MSAVDDLNGMLGVLAVIDLPVPMLAKLLDMFL